MMQGSSGKGGKEEDKIGTNEGSKDSLNYFGPNSNNSMTMSGQEDKSGKDGWNKVKPSKKKQRKLTFGKTPREPSSRPMEMDQGIDSGTGINSGTSKGNKTIQTTVVTPPQGVTKKRKSLEDDKEDGQEEGVVDMKVDEEKTMEEGALKQPPKSVKQTLAKFISIKQTKAMSPWYLACTSNKIVQGLDRDVDLMEEDFKPGLEFYGWFQMACNYSMTGKAGDDKKTVLRDPNHWLQTLKKVPNGDDLRKSEDPAKRKAARNVLEVGIDLAQPHGIVQGPIRL